MTESAHALLAEWLAWWAASDAPAKLPDALQVRTALHLLTDAEQTPTVARDVLRGGALAGTLRGVLDDLDRPAHGDD
jgi:hypothetical protein